MRNATALWLLLGCLCVSLAAPGLTPARPTHAAGPSTLDRPFDPVVLTGADLPRLAGIDPGDLVAFRYDGGWQQIPVQVDERAVKDLGDEVYDGYCCSGITALVYTDAGTFTGPDPDPMLDDDDEIVFMAKDVGGQALSVSDPLGVIPGSGIEVTIADPLDAGTGYVYLFRSDGSLTPDAGQQYVTYTFNLLSGEYLDTYNTHDGPNPEDSVATTPYYSHHFADRWISDEMHVTVGAATGTDILDRHKNLFAPGNCGRSEDTFSDGEGAFIVNKSGPVRALRSYIGANSGPLTQRENIFYESRQDIRTFLRVHAISGIMDFFDYSPDATGMTYHNQLNTSGVTIDGNPDSVVEGASPWELVTGPQGSLVIAGLVSADIPGLTPTSYYLDDSTPPVTQCTGDAFAYGSSGLWVNQSIPNTDPRYSPFYHLSGQRIIYYGAPGLTVPDAEALSDQAWTPLTVTSVLWSDTDDDEIPDGLDNCPSVPNPDQTNTSIGPIDNGPGIPSDDGTVPFEDNVGDACDDDADNDGLLDADEDPLADCGAFNGTAAGHPNPTGGDVTNDDNGDGDPAPLMGTDAADDGPSWDTDNDGILDGAECALGHNPRDANDAPTTAECGGTADSDTDGLLDAWEACGWGTDLSAVDSDSDGLGDCMEAADVDGNAVVDFVGDAVLYAKAALLPAASFGKTMDFDINKDGFVDFVGDVVQGAKLALVEGLCH